MVVFGRLQTDSRGKVPNQHNYRYCHILLAYRHVMGIKYRCLYVYSLNCNTASFGDVWGLAMIWFVDFCLDCLVLNYRIEMTPIALLSALLRALKNGNRNKTSTNTVFYDAVTDYRFLRSIKWQCWIRNKRTTNIHGEIIYILL